MKINYKGLQTRMHQFDWYSSCMFFSICSIAQDVDGDFDFLRCWQESLEHGWLLNDGTVRSALDILAFSVGGKWSREKSAVAVEETASTFVIEEWHNPNTGYTHYRRKNCDPLELSYTVLNGSCVAWHVFKRS